jgi:hypothetical protein
VGALDSPPTDFANAELQAATLATSERWRAAKLAEAYYQSRQYDQLRAWEAGGAMSKRRPREIVPLYKTAIDTIQRFTWGGSRFPRVLVGSTTKEGVDKSEVGPLVNDEVARELTTFVVNLVKQSRLDRCVAEYSRRAMITGSAAVIVGTRGGHLMYFVEPGYHCVPTFEKNNPRRVSRLDILYQFEREEPVSSTATGKKLYWFRRTVDEVADTVYKPVEVRPGQEPKFTVDKDNSTVHGLGFCPVVWVRTTPLSPSAIDGQPVIDPALYPLLDRINYIYSQRGRAVEYILDPQWVRKNVPVSQRDELQKNPGKIWDVEDQGKERPAGIELLEAKGTGSEAASEHLKDLIQRFYEAVGVVLSAMDKMSTRGNVSGVVLEYLHAPMIAIASELRKDLGDDSFCDIINIAMRIVTVQVLGGKDIWIQGARAAAKKIDKSQIDGPWLDMPVRLQWGRFFSPTAQDVGTAVQAAGLAKNILVSETSATRFVSDYFGVTDIDSEVDQLDDPMALQPSGKGAGPTAIPKPKMVAKPVGGQ